MPLNNKKEKLTSSQRLNHNAQFQRFFDQPGIIRLRTCTLFFIKNDVAQMRLGITFKAKATSVERNRVKRCVREVFRTHGEKLSGYDFNVLIPQKMRVAYPYVKNLRENLLGELKNWEESSPKA